MEGRSSSPRDWFWGYHWRPWRGAAGAQSLGEGAVGSSVPLQHRQYLDHLALYHFYFYSYSYSHSTSSKYHFYSYSYFYYYY